MLGINQYRCNFHWEFHDSTSIFPRSPGVSPIERRIKKEKGKKTKKKRRDLSSSVARWVESESRLSRIMLNPGDRKEDSRHGFPNGTEESDRKVSSPRKLSLCETYFDAELSRGLHSDVPARRRWRCNASVRWMRLRGTACEGVGRKRAEKG